MLMIIEPNPPQHAPDDNAMLTNSNVIPNMSNADTVAQKTVPMFGHFVMFGL